MEGGWEEEASKVMNGSVAVSMPPPRILKEPMGLNQLCVYVVYWFCVLCQEMMAGAGVRCADVNAHGFVHIVILFLWHCLSDGDLLCKLACPFHPANFGAGVRCSHVPGRACFQVAAVELKLTHLYFGAICDHVRCHPGCQKHMHCLRLFVCTSVSGLPCRCCVCE